MLALFCIWFLIKSFNKKLSRENRIESIVCTLIFAILVMSLANLFYNTNLVTTPEKLKEEEDEVKKIEERIEAFLDDFDYDSKKGDTPEKVETFIEEYHTLKKELDEAISVTQRTKTRLDRKGNFWTDTLPKIAVDFGLIEKIVQLIK